MKTQSPILRQLSRLAPKASTEVVKLSPWYFALWWIIILTVHVVTCLYNALYAYCYWKLQHTFLNLYLDSFQIGMPPPHHHTIAIVHMIMSVLHGGYVLVMVCSSVYHRSLAFTPWPSEAKIEENKSDRTRSILLQSVTQVYDKIVDRHGLCGVNGGHFHLVHVCREVVETVLQTVQAYRMSLLLPRTLLNRFYVLLLVMNCWSSGILYSFFYKRDEARRRFACITLDCLLDLVACMGVELIVLLSYVGEYSVKITGFPEIIWYNDEWVARALNELKMVVVVSWSDLASRAIFSLGLVLTTTSMKELLQRLPHNKSRIAHSKPEVKGGSDKLEDSKLNAVSPTASPSLADIANSKPSGINLRRLSLRTAHWVFGIWGFLVLGLHIQASTQPTLPQCLMQVRPWAVSRTSCYLAGLDCYALGINGEKDEVEDKWSKFDSSTVVQLLVRHCPKLEIPDLFAEFHQLRNIKIYNSTIVEWGDSAAITQTNHPAMASLFIVRTNMTDGLLPTGLQSVDSPHTLYDIEICATNLRELPDDLDTKWPLNAILQVEYSQLTVVTPALHRLEPYYLALTGNPIHEIPPEVFEVQGMLFLSISNMNLHQLPQNVTQLSTELSWIFIGDTNISFFWEWTDELVERMKGRANPWLAGPSPYCDDLEKIQNGTATSFSVPLTPEYSQTLMDPSEANRNVILKAVRCDPTIEGLFYPLEIEDSFNAISIPPPLVDPV
ncbi:hypothetical protein DVH05_026780 [Phytophthora capsici]|nr:hypothetical protein DVH05_026780 [Phytophthora capsici]